MKTEKVRTMFMKEALGTVCCVMVVLMSAVSLAAYIVDQAILPSQVTILIVPLVALTTSLYGIRSVEGYFTNKLATPDADVDTPEAQPPTVAAPVVSTGPPESGK